MSRTLPSSWTVTGTSSKPTKPHRDSLARSFDLPSRTGPRNILHLMFDPKGMRPFIENWEEVALGLIQRVHREAVGQTIDAKTIELLNDLKQCSGVAELRASAKSHVPVLPITFVKGDKKWSYFSMISTIGTPHCITAQEFRIECMFPAESDETGEPA
jgi:MmyB-like transcription regulator ligand binding domain